MFFEVFEKIIPVVNGYVYLTFPPQTSSFPSLHLAHLRARTCAVCFSLSRARTHTLSFFQSRSIACSLVYSRSFAWSLSLSLSLLCTHCLSCTCNTVSTHDPSANNDTRCNTLLNTLQHIRHHTLQHTLSLSLIQSLARFQSVSLSLSPPPPTLAVLPWSNANTRVRGHCHILGCNNGIGGFHEDLINCQRPELPDFQWAQKMRLKKCSS